jgi:hypothetical protein
MLLSCEDGAQQQLIDIFHFLAKQQQQYRLEQELNQLSGIAFNEMSTEQKNTLQRITDLALEALIYNGDQKLLPNRRMICQFFVIFWHYAGY